MIEDKPLEVFSHLLKELNKRKIAFVEIREADSKDVTEGRK